MAPRLSVHSDVPRSGPALLAAIRRQQVPFADVSFEARVRAEQVDAVFRVAALGVCGAAAAAIILAGILNYVGSAGRHAALVWATLIVGCAIAHIVLRRFYMRARPVGGAWRSWGIAFTTISLVEGIAWGWSPVGLAAHSRFDLELIVLIVTMGVAAGAVPCFGPYLPAFFALFVPATIPYAVTNLIESDPERQGTLWLMLIFIGSMIGLGVAANRSFKELVGLRFRTEELATDLQRQIEIAEEANLAKSTFLAAASHDLRQPIHALGLFVGALQNVAMAPEGRRILEQVEISIDAMDSLFSALLDISRLDAGIVEVHRCNFDAGLLIERVCRDYIADAAGKGIKVVWKQRTAIVDSDPVLIERILRNLVSNAVRYTSTGRIVVGCRRRGATVSIEVWDTGAGIAAEQRESVFREYYQVGNAERDRTKGLGLGLAIVRRLTELLDCHLTLRSQEGRGSCFAVAIPLATREPGPLDPEHTELARALTPGLIVVVDDELAIREAMSTLLTAWGHDVVTAISSDQAVRRLAAVPIPPDLIICDYRLSEYENGIAVVERLRSEYNETIPAMLITGDTAPDRLAEARRSGLLLLHKPVSNSKLRAAIANLMANEKKRALFDPDPAAVI